MRESINTRTLGTRAEPGTHRRPGDGVAVEGVSHSSLQMSDKLMRSLAPTHVALLEDDQAQAEMVKRWLEETGLACSVFPSGRQFLRALGTEVFDLLIFDWNLPDTSGPEVLATVRAAFAMHQPVMFITARDAEQDICAALEAGADDYMTKPVSRNQTVARVRALLRRSQGAQRSGIVQMGAVRVDIARRAVTVDAAPVVLTDKELDLFLFLTRNLGGVFSRKQLLSSVWGTNPELNTRTVDTHVSRIRVKLRLYPERGWRLTSVYSYGYRLEYTGETTE